jgi:hypothetical protein
MFRCSGVIVTCISFSASANVPALTSGPVSGAVPKVGGAPGVVGVEAAGVCSFLAQPAMAPRIIGAWIRN